MSVQDHIDYANNLTTEESVLSELSQHKGGKQRAVALHRRLTEIRTILAEFEAEQYKAENLQADKTSLFAVLDDGALKEIVDV